MCFLWTLQERCSKENGIEKEAKVWGKNSSSEASCYETLISVFEKKDCIDEGILLCDIINPSSMIMSTHAVVVYKGRLVFINRVRTWVCLL